MNTVAELPGKQTFKPLKVWVKLFATYVRPHLEFAVQAWSPWNRGEINKIEKVQQRALNQCSELSGLSYEEKLTRAGLTSLEDRRKRADMIETWKILNGVERVNEQTWFTRHQNVSNRVTRATASDLNLKEELARTEQRKNFFSVRAAKYWNEIPLHRREQKA